MNKQEIIERLSADEDRCKYCNSSTVSGGDIYCSAGHSHDMNCGGKEFKLDYKIEEVISALEQQLTNGWIPVSERLPEESGHYLVTYHEWSKGEYLPKFDFTCEKILRFYRGEFRMPVCCNDKIEQDIGREVVAWQPLPEPYKEVSE